MEGRIRDTYKGGPSRLHRDGIGDDIHYLYGNILGDGNVRPYGDSLGCDLYRSPLDAGYHGAVSSNYHGVCIGDAILGLYGSNFGGYLLRHLLKG